MSIKMTGTSPDPAVDSVFQRADRDPGITRAGNPDPSQSSTAAQPAKPGFIQGNDRPFYANDGVAEHLQVASNDVDPPPNAGNSWRSGRDLYAVGGGVDGYLDNQGT